MCSSSFKIDDELVVGGGYLFDLVNMTVKSHSHHLKSFDRNVEIFVEKWLKFLEHSSLKAWFVQIDTSGKVSFTSVY